jgi:hypothetical protein
MSIDSRQREAEDEIYSMLRQVVSEFNFTCRQQVKEETECDAL